MFDYLCLRTVSLLSNELNLPKNLVWSQYNRLLLSLPAALNKAHNERDHQLEQLKDLETVLPIEIVNCINLHLADNNFTEIYLGLSGLSTHLARQPWQTVMGAYSLFARFEHLRFKYCWTSTQSAIDTFFDQVIFSKQGWYRHYNG